MSKPTGGTFKVNKVIGDALQEEFNLTCQNWKSYNGKNMTF
jgi:hypothetical protein